MVIVDQFTKMIRLKVTTTTVSSEKIAKIYRDNIWKIHRILKKILNNRRLQFTLQFIKDLNKILRIKQTLSTVYHPQNNSQMKRINQEVKVFLQHYINYQHDNQTKQLLVVKFQYNNKKHAAIGYTPFKLNFGQYLQKRDLTIKAKLPKLETFLKKL